MLNDLCVCFCVVVYDDMFWNMVREYGVEGFIEICLFVFYCEVLVEMMFVDGLLVM